MRNIVSFYTNVMINSSIISYSPGFFNGFARTSFVSLHEFFYYLTLPLLAITIFFLISNYSIKLKDPFFNKQRFYKIRRSVTSGTPIRSKTTHFTLSSLKQNKVPNIKIKHNRRITINTYLFLRKKIVVMPSSKLKIIR